MPTAYWLDANGKARKIPEIMCTNEDRELQVLLEKNPDLLPGEQMSPDDPLRWLVIKREMAVQSPETGSGRWSIDLVLVDHKGVPTFVECKRFADTRARREVVGQMLDYAANGHAYWDRESLLDNFRQQCASSGAQDDEQIEARVRELLSDEFQSVDDLFSTIETNLREGQIRLVFFMEKSPYELRSIVDFLNRQMERTEVLIVEAQQLEHDGVRIVVPQLFGYTEEARRVKRRVATVTVEGERWTEQRFFENAASRLENDAVLALRKLLGAAAQLDVTVRWGAGKRDGSYSWSMNRGPLSRKIVLSAYSSGHLTFPIATLRGTVETEQIAAEFISDIEKATGATDLGNWKYPSFRADRWVFCVDEVLDIYRRYVTRWQGTS